MVATVRGGWPHFVAQVRLADETTWIYTVGWKNGTWFEYSNSFDPAKKDESPNCYFTKPRRSGVGKIPKEYLP